MNSNFNVVKKQKKEEEEENFLDEEEVEVQEEKNPVLDRAAKRRMLLFMGIIFGGMIFLFLILYIISLFSHPVYKYSDIENILKKAAVSYFKDYPDSLPAADGDIVEIDSSNLVTAGKMKDLSEYTSEGVLCTGTVQVENASGEYLYSPYLNCGDNYTTVELVKKILDDSSIVNSGYGLYSMNGAYVYRGENVNNYVKFGSSLWRIVKINSNNNIVLVNDTGIKFSSQPWDDRYNEVAAYKSGFNQYSASRIREYLNKIYENPDKDDGEKLLSNKDKAKIVPFNVCTGKRSPSSEGSNNQEECAEVLRDQMYGLLTLSEYMNASIDANCTKANSKTCVNYNYLAQVKDWWLVTANKDDDITVFKINYNGLIKTDFASSYSIARPVVYLNSKVLYKSGNGTLEKPYKIK